MHGGMEVAWRAVVILFLCTIDPCSRWIYLGRVDENKTEPHLILSLDEGDPVHVARNALEPFLGESVLDTVLRNGSDYSTGRIRLEFEEKGAKLRTETEKTTKLTLR